MCKSNNMCNVKASTSSVRAVILVLDLMLFLQHDAKSLPKKAGPNRKLIHITYVL
jgi:hypothetical protein